MVTREQLLINYLAVFTGISAISVIPAIYIDEILNTNLIVISITVIAISTLLNIYFLKKVYCHFQLFNGIKYAMNVLKLELRIRKHLIETNYFISKDQLFIKEYIKLPKILIYFNQDFSAGDIFIENHLKYDKKFDVVRLSSALGEYIVEVQYLTDDENYYCFEFIDSSINKQIEFNDVSTLRDTALILDENELIFDLYTSLNLQGTLIVGQTGSGKTYALYSIILQFISKNIDYNLYFADPKNSSTAVIGAVINEHQTATEINEIITLLEEFVREMLIRQEQMNEYLRSSVDSSYIDFDLEPYVFIFDEFASFQLSVNTLPKAQRDNVSDLLSQVVLKGRQLGFFLIIVMQKSDSTLIPTYLRENLPLKIVLGNAEKQTYVTAFGTGIDIPDKFYEIGEGLFTSAGVTNVPKPIVMPKLNFDIYEAFLKLSQKA